MSGLIGSCINNKCDTGSAIAGIALRLVQNDYMKNKEILKILPIISSSVRLSSLVAGQNSEYLNQMDCAGHLFKANIFGKCKYWKISIWHHCIPLNSDGIRGNLFRWHL